MVLIQFNLSEEADKKVRKYMYEFNMTSKGEAINKLLERRVV